MLGSQWPSNLRRGFPCHTLVGQTLLLFRRTTNCCCKSFPLRGASLAGKVKSITEGQRDMPSVSKLEEGPFRLALTQHPFDSPYVSAEPSKSIASWMIDFVKSPHAGAVVTFTGTTRNTFEDRRVSTLFYSAYKELALRSMLSIAQEVHSELSGPASAREHELVAIGAIHRLGEVPVGEESILVAVSAKHRRLAFESAEMLLEKIKLRVEIWKQEVFADGGAEWRANMNPEGKT